MSNPLVDRILSNPLTFVAAKQPEKESSAEKHPSYIVLGNEDHRKHDSRNEASFLKPKKQNVAKVKHRSMADAIAAYTGRKYMSKAEKKASKKAAREGAKQGEEEDAQKVDSKSLDDESHSDDSSSDSSSESHYELALEFHTDLSFHGFRTSSDDDVKSDTSEAEASREETDDDDVAIKDDDDNDEDSDDETYDEEDAADDDSNDEEAMDDEDELGPRPGADKVSSASPGASEESSDSKEDLHLLKMDLLADARKADAERADAASEESQELQVKAKAEATTSRTLLLGKHPEGHFKITEPAIDRGLNGSLRIIKNWTAKFRGKHPVGLLNFGVTCYMNSAIQLMVHIPAVQHYLLEVLEGKHELPPKSVTQTVAELSYKMWGFNGGNNRGPNKFVNPKKVIQRLFDINCMMSEWQQEDSHEYFMSLMSRFQEDSVPKGRKLNESIMYDIFGGLLQQEVICRECNTVSTTKQEFYDLSLGLNKKRRSSETEEIPCGRYSLEKSINEYFSTELIRKDKVDESSGYYCEKCKKRTMATKKSVIELSPETLMVHLKRFKFNGSSSSKVKQPIIYPEYLDLTPFTLTNQSTKYQLISVIVHEGRSILSGHYVCHCLQPDGTWSTYDDEYINKTDERMAMSDPSAYCLIYTKLTPKDTSTTTNGISKKRRRDDGPVTKKAKH